MPSDPLTMLQIASAIGLAVFGVWSLAMGRRDPPPSWIRLPGAGTISTVSLTVMGLASVLMGYHLFAYSMNLAQFRAPMWIVVVGGLVAVSLSLLNDAIEHRSDSRDDS